jgi:hypothetical protein
MTTITFDRAVELYREEVAEHLASGFIDQAEADRRMTVEVMMQSLTVAISIGMVARAE